MHLMKVFRENITLIGDFIFMQCHDIFRKSDLMADMQRYFEPPIYDGYIVILLLHLEPQQTYNSKR